MIFNNNLNMNRLNDIILANLKKLDNNTNNEYLIVKDNIKTKQEQLIKVYLDKLNNKITEDIYDNVYNIINKEIEKLQIKETIYYDKLNNNHEQNIINDILSFKNIRRSTILKLINKIEIDKNKNMDIYLKFNNNIIK